MVITGEAVAGAEVVGMDILLASTGAAAAGGAATVGMEVLLVASATTGEAEAGAPGIVATPARAGGGLAPGTVAVFADEEALLAPLDALLGLVSKGLLEILLPSASGPWEL